MKISKKITLLSTTTLLAFGAMAMVGCGSTAKGPQGLYEKKCGTCHPLSTVENAAYKGDEWKAVVDRMKNMTGAITDSDADQITKYLSENMSK